MWWKGNERAKRRAGVARIEEKRAEFSTQFTVLTSVFKDFTVSVIGTHAHTHVRTHTRMRFSVYNRSKPAHWTCFYHFILVKILTLLQRYCVLSD